MPHRRAAAVVRFSSLGDVLLAAHVPGYLREADPSRRVLFVTKERYAALLRGHQDIDRFYVLRERVTPGASAAMAVRGTLGDLIAAMRNEGVEEVVDLHRNLRSARVAGVFPKAKRLLAPKHALRRRLLVYARWLRPRPVPPLLHTYRALCGLGPAELPNPWLRQALSPTELARGAERAGEAAEGGAFVLLAVGARWETKRWPASHFLRLGEEITFRLGLKPVYAAEPGERAHAEIRTALGPERLRSAVALPFRDLMAVAAHARAIVSNDSAALHLGPALDIPAVGVFGGTVPAFGFARQGPRDEVAEIGLWCRPCSVHGRARCPLGHHACMRRLDPSVALDALARSLGRSDAPDARNGEVGPRAAPRS